MNNKNELRSDKLQQENFSLDQLDLLASKLGQSVESLQMMIDGVAEVRDSDARLIEQLLEKPRGYLDGAPTLNTNGKRQPVVSEITGDSLNSLNLNDHQVRVVRKFIALSENRQKVVSDMIDALTESND